MLLRAVPGLSIVLVTLRVTQAPHAEREACRAAGQLGLKIGLARQAGNGAKESAGQFLEHLAVALAAEIGRQVDRLADLQPHGGRHQQAAERRAVVGGAVDVAGNDRRPGLQGDQRRAGAAGQQQSARWC